MGPGEGQANLRQHGVSVEKAATVFLDPLAMSYPDPDHSQAEDREITIGYSTNDSSSCPTSRAAVGRGYSAHRKRPEGSASSMKKAPA
ncbi:MAG: BrnT family toxin [Candidatus Binatia bacterium]